jgi:hypothetical protein
MKNHIPIENRLAKAKSFKTDNVLKTFQIMKKLETLHKHAQKLSAEEIEEMWPSVDQSIANDNINKKVHKKVRMKDREFLISLISRATQTINALKFAKDKADLNLEDKEVQDVIKQKSLEQGRNP